ncbi:MAG: 16S rRNA (cytosine(1402)-N(4))-methyltransferase RsmH [Nitrospiraceae bacterium]|jgi:16S rRNA (cytosine1402-N4)-methyltransferase|nr:16S rRNA (cytosine(1402)-N(4))-methyltransferase RsmH [Nitrospiraceae bacterium]
MTEFSHVPVMRDEVLVMLDIRPEGTYIDATVGLGGHSAAILALLGERGRLLGIDRDEAALAVAAERLGNGRVKLKKAAFADLLAAAQESGIEACDGILLDLGVSMMQLKDHERGFSFQSGHELDMRMDTAQPKSAWHIVNEEPEQELARIIHEYGEEPLSRRIARRIVAERKKRKIDTCVQLASIVASACGRRGKTHPATRTFQGLRIAVNREMEQLRSGLESAGALLNKGGRLCVLTYHSLEDRMVKHFMRDGVREGRFALLTKKPVSARREEVMSNPAARSAKLRGVERL